MYSTNDSPWCLIALALKRWKIKTLDTQKVYPSVKERNKCQEKESQKELKRILKEIDRKGKDESDVTYLVVVK